MKILKFFFLTTGLMVLNSCYKVEHTRENKYDEGYAGTRDYTLEFDHIEVVNETSTANVNGLLDVEERATLRIFLKNNGPDPCMLNSGTFKTDNLVNGFYIFNSEIGINDGGFQFLGSSELKGYKVHYIDPGAVDYLSCDVRIYPYCNPNQDVACTFMLTDFDGATHEVKFNVHVE